MTKFLSKLQLNQLGIALIDKPSGMTSHDVVDFVRRQTGIKKVGHCGTLDPLASGLLIILIGREFTKQQSKFLKLDKKYLVEAKLGVNTDTYDIDGQIQSQTNWSVVSQLSKKELQNVIKQFLGKQQQTVPAFSAVKIKGQKLYNLARKNKIDEINLPSRTVHFYQLDLIKFKIDHKTEAASFKLAVHCSSGTYIRSLIHDIGQKLTVDGQIINATVTKLRRTAIGEYEVKNQLHNSQFPVSPPH